ncbi:MAG: LysR family transcriptional regulator [Methylibium sp. NZG]|nr:MAG: LysR family transcriptional regulator [Methylibium sp. NZG]
MVTKCGGVARAGERLHVTPQSISTQIRQLESAIGGTLWRRSGRKLELTDTGHLVMEYAERLFTVGEALKDALRERPTAARTTFRVGVSGSVVKVVAYRLVAPALQLSPPPRLVCREGRLAELLALLAVHELDLVISDRAMPSSMNVRGFNHLLAEGGVSFLATPQLVRRLKGRFPHGLDQAPMLLPGTDSAMRPQLIAWFDSVGVRPDVVGDFDDTAVMKAFGQAGAGVFAMPTMVAKETAKQFGVVAIGKTDQVVHRIYAVTGERRLSNPAVLAIQAAASANALTTA